MKTSEHFRALIDTARTEGIEEALWHDFEETLNRHPKLKPYVLAALIYDNTNKAYARNFAGNKSRSY